MINITKLQRIVFINLFYYKIKQSIYRIIMEVLIVLAMVGGAVFGAYKLTPKN